VSCHCHPTPISGYGIESAFWYWSKHAKLNTLSDKGKSAIKAITRRVNGGYNGLKDRTQKYETIIKLLKEK
jgi:putative chitinase